MRKRFCRFRRPRGPKGGGSRELALAGWREAIRHQREGWVLALGGEAVEPEIADIEELSPDVLRVFLRIRGEKDEKPLYFRRDQAGRLYFVGIQQPSYVTGSATVAAVEVWSWRYDNWAPFDRGAGWGFSEFDCGQPKPSAVIVPANSSVRRATACEPGGTGSCYAWIESVGVCAGLCWYQWVGRDVWWDSQVSCHH